MLEPPLVPTEVCPLPQLFSASQMSSLLGLGGQEWVQGILALSRLTERLLPQSLCILRLVTTLSQQEKLTGLETVKLLASATKSQTNLMLRLVLVQNSVHWQVFPFMIFNWRA